MWTIQLLGGLAVHGPQRQVTRFRTQKAASLLAYLAFHSASQSRATLIDMLWPDAPPDIGRRNLSNALFFIRHVLEPPGVPPGTVLLADRASVRLNPAAITVDVAAFENDLSRAEAEDCGATERLTRLLRAVERYEGTLLPGFYEEWVPPEALRLESLFVQGALQLIPLLLNAGRPEAALTYAQRAVRADSLSEETTQCLMKALVACGQSGKALRAYRALKKRLLEEMDVEPCESLQRLARQLGRSGSASRNRMLADRAAQGGDVTDIPAAIPPPPESRMVPPELDAAGAGPHGVLAGAEFLLRTTTRFFGREEEVGRLGEMLSSPRTRLVTLTGPGGTGKTRLALEVAASLVERPKDASLAGAPKSAVFVPLAPVVEAERLFEVILRSLGSLPASDQAPLDQLAHVLEAQPHTLLVLDNFEQLAEEGALCVHDLLGKSAGVKLLLTSRQRLHIEGEREFRIAPLPTSNGAQTVEALACVPSIALFVDRAQATLPDFQLTQRNATVIGQLCDYLEGLPLAIELAASRVALFTPIRILEQVQTGRLDFLVTRRRDAASRQRTLRATLDWSFQLLSESAQACLAQLSVFRGGWTLEAAQAVCQCSETDMIEWLTLLRDSSLIGLTDTDEGLRFTLLETVREYASERLEQGGNQKHVQQRHCDYFLALAEEAMTQAENDDAKAVWYDRLEADHDNLRAALAWCQEIAAVAKGMRMAVSLFQFWEWRGYWREGLSRLTHLLAQEGGQDQPALRAAALQAAGILLNKLNDFPAARRFLEEGLAIQQQLGERQAIAVSLRILGNITTALHDVGAARSYFEQAATLSYDLGDQRGEAMYLCTLGLLAWDVGDYLTARSLFERSLTLARELGSRAGETANLTNLGGLARAQGDLPAARTYFEQVLAINRELDHRGGIANDLCNLGETLRLQEDLAAARAHFEPALTLSRDQGNRLQEAEALLGLGRIAQAEGDVRLAYSLIQQSLQLSYQIHCLKELAAPLEAFAALLTLQDEQERAVCVYGAAHALREQLPIARAPIFEETYRAEIEALRQALGEEVFSRAWEAGKRMSLAAAIRYATE
jgi:predicted ATPase/DNA-binding SARP family transcriptional activator